MTLTIASPDLFVILGTYAYTIEGGYLMRAPLGHDGLPLPELWSAVDAFNPDPSAHIARRMLDAGASDSEADSMAPAAAPKRPTVPVDLPGASAMLLMKILHAQHGRTLTLQPSSDDDPDEVINGRSARFEFCAAGSPLVHKLSLLRDGTWFLSTEVAS